MILQKNYPLATLNTFGIAATANYFVQIESLEQLRNIYQNDEYALEKKLLLGGGSNLLFTNNYQGIVLKMSMLGKSITKETNTHVYLKVAAGENWHQTVCYTIEQGWGGLENLSLIPGTVGAAPLQNIGAYGVELKDSFYELEAYNIVSGELHIFNNADCKFGYRDSVFKNEARGNYIVLSVTFKLNKKHQLHLEYGAIKEVLQQKNISKPTIADVAAAVVTIRQSKLPNPAEIGNAGSFFKNPEVALALFEKLKIQYPELPSYPVSDSTVKIPAGWLIEKAGWKGHRQGNVGVHNLQALVLVNYGGGTGQQVKELSEKIQASIFEKFGIKLQAEVNFVG
jgi:UDP-N-acetylmuramate dehydrogenase